MTSFTLPTFLCVVILSSMAWVKSEMCQGPCYDGWVYNNLRCFRYISDKKSWIDAEVNCVSIGGNLASECCEEDDNFMKELQKSAHGDGPFWIGLTDLHKENVWIWSDGTHIRYTHWNDGEPNNLGEEHCVHTNWGAAGGWNDISCEKEYPSVCAMEIPR
uniref:C-type lectin n=1 Tax=Echidna delicatula TaxID=217851 RepID=Q5KSX8_ECHDE|nr:C-type lectin [Echidna delicatula]